MYTVVCPVRLGKGINVNCLTPVTNFRTGAADDDELLIDGDDNNLGKKSSALERNQLLRITFFKKLSHRPKISLILKSFLNFNYGKYKLVRQFVPKLKLIFHGGGSRFPRQ